VAERQTQWIQNPQSNSSNSSTQQQITELDPTVWGPHWPFPGNPDPKFILVAQRWSQLPDHIRAAILTLAGIQPENSQNHDPAEPDSIRLSREKSLHTPGKRK
jgi:hypothetical protein